jgi:glycosyltransferase involved in cell wall biosynthesis
MDPFPVIVSAYNNAAVLADALCSVEQALAFLRDSDSPVRAAVEVVVVDDGSTDDMAGVLRDATRGKDFYTLVRRPRPSSPACARNAGAAARGELLLFLDEDDL